MRKLFAILAVTVLVAACTPKEVADFLNKPVKSVTKEEVKKVSTLYEEVQKQQANQFLVAAAALRNNPFLVCTRAHESDTAGGYKAFNSEGPYYGAYQFLQNTWNNTVRHAGWPFLIGPDIRNIDPFWQDMTAMHLYQWQGKGPWGGRC